MNYRLYSITIFLLFITLSCLSFVLFVGESDAQTSACSDPYSITHTFESGAAWSLCWEWRPLDGIVLHDIQYTTASGIQRTVLKEAAAAELHVNYDNNSVTYLDLSREGLGINLEGLVAADCPNGTIHPHNVSMDVGRLDVRNVLCEMVHAHGLAWKHQEKRGYSSALTLFSISRISAYEYVYQWEFFDDGTIEISVGATGILEEYGIGAGGYGWSLDDDPDQAILGLSHVHNYWFRLDFDIDGAEMDSVEQFDFELREANGLRRLMIQSPIVTETMRSVSPETYRFWRVKDSQIINEDGHAISYRLEPTTKGIYSDPGAHVWSEHELYVTQYEPCERWMVNNPAVNNCGETALDYIADEQSVSDEDVVLWYGMSFHHLPRDEDEPYMPIHWESFHLVPHDWMAESEVVPLTNPMAISMVALQDGGEVAAEWRHITLGILSLSFLLNIVFVRHVVQRRG